ncbi:hypothetical protein PMIT1323_00579 [Prochlorococcus marinus str. MIT 1323]|nr:hypothetical protein PMIT1323_00579 [Prochlorococcus marinus str. MIT 1323]
MGWWQDLLLIAKEAKNNQGISAKAGVLFLPNKSGHHLFCKSLIFKRDLKRQCLFLS